MENEIIDVNNKDIEKLVSTRDVAFGLILWLNLGSNDLLFSNVFKQLCLHLVRDPILNYTISNIGSFLIAVLISYLWIRFYYLKPNGQRMKAIIWLIASFVFLQMINLLFVFVLSEKYFDPGSKTVQFYYETVEAKVPDSLVSEILLFVEVMLVLIMIFRKTKKNLHS